MTEISKFCAHLMNKKTFRTGFMNLYQSGEPMTLKSMSFKESMDSLISEYNLTPHDYYTAFFIYHAIASEQLEFVALLQERSLVHINNGEFVKSFIELYEKNKEFHYGLPFRESLDRIIEELHLNPHDYCTAYFALSVQDSSILESIREFWDQLHELASSDHPQEK